MKITVISCFYNAARFVPHAVRRLKAQTHTDFEALFINDGSTDGTGALLQEHTQGDSRFKIITTGNKGLSAARNTGLSHATGDYITFFDSDDDIADNWLGVIAGAIERTHPDMTVCGYSEINPGLKTACEFRFPDMTLEGSAIAGNFAGLLSGMKFNNGFMWNKAYRADFLKENNITVPLTRIQQDELFNHRCYLAAKKITLISEAPYSYYIYEKGNIRSHHIPGRMDIYAEIYNSYRNIVCEFNIDSPELDRYIDRRLINSAIVAGIYNTRHLENRVGEVAAVLRNRELQQALSRNASGIMPWLMKRKQARLFLAAGEMSSLAAYVRRTVRRILWR